MEKIKHIKIKELNQIVKQLDLPEDTWISLIIEEDRNTEVPPKIKTQQALRELKGSGTGSLLDKLLKDRKEDKKIEKNST